MRRLLLRPLVPRSGRPGSTRGGGLRKLLHADLFEQARNGSRQDLSDVTVGDLMPHERAQLFELCVRLAIRGELDAVALGAESLGARSRGGGGTDGGGCQAFAFFGINWI